MKKFKYLILILCFMLSINAVFAKTLTVESNKQVYDDTKKMIMLEDNVNVTIDDINIKSPKAFVTINGAGKPDTATFTGGARAIQITKDSKSETKASILKLSLLTKEVEATGDVHSKIEKLGKPTITLKSDYQSFDAKTNIMDAKDNVILIYDDIKATSNTAKIWISQKGGLDFLKLIGNAKIIQDKAIVSAQEVHLNAKTEEMTAVGSAFTNISIDDSDTVKIWATNQQYNNKTNTAIASGNTKIIYNDYVATGPKAVMVANPKTRKPNKIFFSGRSTINDGAKSISADSIVITMNPKNFTAQGNVKTQIDDIGDVK
ncbi:MAG: hypothetical protein MJ180_03405 [Candidatus Gastranaerophilales bacterium]|nr:hypothetical protein [Candidatus Gastranaerophilales bacterium]